MSSSLAANQVFAHGVASGDPLVDRLLLWTRISLPADVVQACGPEVVLYWEVASSADFTEILQSASVLTSAASDFTVKVDLAGLHAGQTIFYRFAFRWQQQILYSRVGRGKTLPAEDVQQVNLAVFSCSNYPCGYFHVFSAACQHTELDFALHLGDYIYEYGGGGPGSSLAEEMGRASNPVCELCDLQDYRQRYAQYRSDPALQEIHAMLPFIVVWDDHEIANDAWRDGARAEQDPQAFARRKAAALQAYHEWLPIRLPDASRPECIYRSFDFGRLASLHMLETRLAAREQAQRFFSFVKDKQLDTAALLAAVTDPARELLGQQQMDWLRQQVAASGAQWQILGQQVLMARMYYPQPVALGQVSLAEYVRLRRLARSAPQELSASQSAILAAPLQPFFLDFWDGYQAERERVFDLMQGRDLLVLAGDTHNAWASDLCNREGQPVGVEFATPSVSSPGMERSFADIPADEVAAMLREVIPSLVYAQTSQRGFLLLQIQAQQICGQWHFVDDVTRKEFKVQCAQSLQVLAGQRSIRE